MRFLGGGGDLGRVSSDCERAREREKMEGDETTLRWMTWFGGASFIYIVKSFVACGRESTKEHLRCDDLRGKRENGHSKRKNYTWPK